MRNEVGNRRRLYSLANMGQDAETVKSMRKEGFNIFR